MGKGPKLGGGGSKRDGGPQRGAETPECGGDPKIGWGALKRGGVLKWGQGSQSGGETPKLGGGPKEVGDPKMGPLRSSPH